MKKLTKILMVFLLTIFLFTSCKVFDTVQVPKFTSVENLFTLKLGSTLDAVITQLGCKPYDIYSNQIDGYSIYLYKYKTVERKVSPKIINEKGGETAGTEVYNGKEQNLFLFFKDNKLEAFITDEGKKNSPSIIILNNTIYSVTKDKDKYIIVPTASEESSHVAAPMTFGRKKK